jgi:hypothetical protein
MPENGLAARDSPRSSATELVSHGSQESDLYASIWKSCDELRGTDMVALKGKPDVGEQDQTQVIKPLVGANARLPVATCMASTIPNKLGEGQAMVDRLDLPANLSCGTGIPACILCPAVFIAGPSVPAHNGMLRGPPRTSRTLEARNGRPAAHSGSSPVHDPACRAGEV